MADIELNACIQDNERGSLFLSTGTLRYSVGKGELNTTYSLRVVIDPEVSRYYRAMIPKWIRTQPQMHAPHISVVRKEVPVHLEHWGKYEGQEVEFEYENIVRFGAVYVWLNCFCTRLEEIRAELGLPVHSPYTLPPEGFTHCFHSSLGNKKASI